MYLNLLRAREAVRKDARPFPTNLVPATAHAPPRVFGSWPPQAPGHGLARAEPVSSRRQRFRLGLTASGRSRCIRESVWGGGNSTRPMALMVKPLLQPLLPAEGLFLPLDLGGRGS